jgi:ABC-type cobalamin/Fe3+-siderophores transport system ATPase subunit
VEEIPRHATHGLLLKDGRTLALGPLNEVLTDTHLSNLYNYPCKVTASNNNGDRLTPEKPHRFCHLDTTPRQLEVR